MWVVCTTIHQVSISNQSSFQIFKVKRIFKRNDFSGTLGSQSQIPLSPVDVKPSMRSPNPSPPPQSATNVGGQNVAAQKKMDIVQFLSVSDRRPAVYFIPDIYGEN